ncbi:nitroreductase family deazaflavin-dependent oxidoreductase [Skermania sp. ID1734]|uniref:nitroreductase/quinone reductase family protein n=1 Tax=Skermania sp. ID1734 TaxID=2597516 RepID=UPI00117DDC5F|nr:nitroreductase/quinone reductase family protein [Skermania sp. ID1734]TSD99526.1 nitroreductase family deazaflavin-dependent oxidoreductase [Skermania sp. ID1734]
MTTQGSVDRAIFAVVNRTVNPLLSGILASPLHFVASGQMATLTVTGRKTGREYAFPVGYVRTGNEVQIGIEWPERKQWWRNLRTPAPVRIRIRGVEYTGQGQAIEDGKGGVKVRVTLD